MIACTSISPKHANNDIQLKAVDSWHNLGLKVYSFNCKAECDLLAPLYPNVTFIETSRTMEHHFSKPYVQINAIFDWCKEQEDNKLCLINSDIELVTDKETIGRIDSAMDEKMLMCNRVNYDTEYKGSQYLQGIDVFFIHKKYLHLYPQTIFCLGQCHFDYWIPFTASKNGVEVQFIRQDIAFHKNHNVQYSEDNWNKTGRYFMWNNDLYQFHPTQGIGKMSTFVFNYIYNYSKRKEI
jgi:hypothetical protein